MRAQCELLEVPRSSLDYLPVGESEEDRELMRLMDEIYLIDPCIGTRRLVKVLERDHGRKVNRKRPGRKTHHPLLAVLGEAHCVLHAWLRSGNTSASCGVSHFLSEALELVPADWKIRCVRAESGFFSRFKRGDELVQKHLVHGQRALAVSAFFESAERGAGGEVRVAVDGGLPELITAQGVVIVEVFVALDGVQDALAHELLLGVGDEARVAVVGQGLAQILDKPEARIHLADEQQAAVAGDLAALKGHLDFSALEAVKMELGWVTDWHWRVFGCVFVTHRKTAVHH